MRDYPQRLTPPAAPGALLKRAFGLAQRVKTREAVARDPVYLNLVRQMPCLKCGMEPPPVCEAAHVRMQSGAHGKTSGMRKTPDDKWALPLCAACHRLDRDAQHNIGEALFWHILGINPILTCTRLYGARGDIVRMRAVALRAIAERTVTSAE